MIEVAVLVSVPAAAVALVLLLLTRVGGDHERRDGSLSLEPPTRTAATVRRLTGLYVRMPDPLTPPDRQRSGSDW